MNENLTALILRYISCRFKSIRLGFVERSIFLIALPTNCPAIFSFDYVLIFSHWNTSIGLKFVPEVPLLEASRAMQPCQYQRRN